MTLQTLHISKSYAASEGEDTFAYDFLVFQNSHFNVYVGIVLQDYGTDFIATGVGDPLGGNIILTTPIAPGGATVLIKRIVPITQMADYVENDALPAEVLERGFDKLTMIAQQLQSAIVSGGGGAGDEALLDAINAHISDTDDSVHTVGTHIETHNALATGVHGVGASTVETVLGSQNKVNSHAGGVDAHAATALATAGRIVYRDVTTGRAAIATGSAASDIANTGQVTAVSGSVTTHAALTVAHGATDAATPDRIVLRDAAGTSNFSDATSASHPATWGQANTQIDADVAAHSALTLGVHGSGASQLATINDIATHNNLTDRHGAGGTTLETIVGSQNKVDTHSALTLGVHGSASQLANINDISTHNNLTDRHGAGGTSLETVLGSQAKVDTHNALFDRHSATALATAGRIILRDATSGTAAIADGFAAGDIINRGQLDTHVALDTGVHGVGASTVESATGSQAKVDTHAGLTGSTAHSATAAATANRIMLRDASGRSAVATGSAAGDIANTGQITTHSNLTTGIHGATATPTASRIPIASASGSLDAWVSTIGFNNMIHVRDVKSTGTAGGTFTSGAWRTRTLNTTVSNSIAGASLASSQITLPAGTYYVSLRAPANKVDAHQIRWQNVTDATNILFGSNAFCGSAAAYAQTDSMLFGVFTLAATKNIELQHQCATSNATNGFGRPTSWGDEVYSEVVVFKI